MHRKWTELLHPDKDLEIHSKSSGQSLWGFQTPLCWWSNNTYFQAAILAVCRAGLPGGWKGIVTKQLPKPMAFGCRSKNTYEEEVQSWHLRIGLVISLLPHLCRKVTLCQPGTGRGDWAVSPSGCYNMLARYDGSHLNSSTWETASSGTAWATMWELYSQKQKLKTQIKVIYVTVLRINFVKL